VAPAFENEAIRANLDGSFADLLIAVEQHPAMLIYLDNAASVGPFSVMGQRRDRGLNENLAREILELHTLGVDGGYSQEDVTALARMITGWSVAQDPSGNEGPTGSFIFRPRVHEPGTQYLLGRAYRQQGLAQGESALQDLAVHPATARHIARKLVRHFVADDPPAAAVEAIEQIFMETKGHLPSVHAALIDLEAAWQPGLRKFKTPEEFLVSVARANAGAMTADNYRLVQFLTSAQEIFGQVPFTAPSPAGWSDDADSWANPDALLKRIEWINMLAQNLPVMVDPLQWYSNILPLEESVWREISRAESSAQAMVLVMAGPQFQWRSA
jgi:uncharacterized protein (DUF1800 family)